MPTNPPTFVLNIKMQGYSKSALKESLAQILSEFDDSYGKPKQGNISQFEVETSVSTPIWDGKEY